MAASEQMWFCYMVRCKDGLLYVGIATDLEERVKEHNWGVGASFTAKRRPVEMIWWEEFRSQKAARSRERELKGWRREKKLKLAKVRTLQPQKARLQGESPKAGDSGESSNG